MKRSFTQHDAASLAKLAFAQSITLFVELTPDGVQCTINGDWADGRPMHVGVPPVCASIQAAVDAALLAKWGTTA